ncbi:hypothetical protein ACRRTK_010198 [Alexandromys fortis]
MLSGEVILQLASEPVLPFSALDIALGVQNSLRGDEPSVPHLLAMASHLRESAEIFQSDEMRPANDPKERAPSRVRMLNDILQDLEKNFLITQQKSVASVGIVPVAKVVCAAPLRGAAEILASRNILYHLDGKTSQFSIIKEAWEQCSSLASNETIQEALSNVLNSIHSAQVFLKAGLNVFENVLVDKN